MKDPNFPNAPSVLIARLDPLFAGMLLTEGRENPVQRKRRRSLTEVSCAPLCRSGEDYNGVAVERVLGMRCREMCCSTTAERNPRSWAEAWSLTVEWCLPTGEGAGVDIARKRYSQIVGRRH